MNQSILLQFESQMYRCCCCMLAMWVVEVIAAKVLQFLNPRDGNGLTGLQICWEHSFASSCTGDMQATQKKEKWNNFRRRWIKEQVIPSWHLVSC